MGITKKVWCLSSRILVIALLTMHIVTPVKALPEHYIHLYTPSESQTASLTRFLEFLVQQERDRYQDEMSTDNQKGSELVWNTLLEVYLMSKVNFNPPCCRSDDISLTTALSIRAKGNDGIKL